MRAPIRFQVWSILVLLVLALSCSKETIIVEDNVAPTINHVPAIRVEHYINRLYIDLLGREPLDAEMSRDFEVLKNGSLEPAARRQLIDYLQTSTDFLSGDTSYVQAYYQNIYNLAKLRCLEGASDELLRNNNDGVEAQKLQAVLDSRTDLQAGRITIDELFGRMVFNTIYDEINMNSFNFVNATFDNLLWRFPTQQEFQSGFDMVEYNRSRTLFGQPGRNKEEYVNIVSQSEEALEGIVIWAYQQLLARRPTTEETVAAMSDFRQHKDIRLLHQELMTGDEYANFE
ncbi:MAG: hypothetical protein AAGG75_20035 [Bacteroidota bacterium]